jgi:hypothetical protein
VLTFLCGCLSLFSHRTLQLEMRGVPANFNAQQERLPFNEFELVANRSQPELLAGFRRYGARRIPLSIRLCRLVGRGRYPVGFARGSGIGGRRKGADVRSADAVTPINGGTWGADIGPLGDMPILLSHYGRAQDGCGDQPSRQNVKSGHGHHPPADQCSNRGRLTPFPWVKHFPL